MSRMTSTVPPSSSVTATASMSFDLPFSYVAWTPSRARSHPPSSVAHGSVPGEVILAAVALARPASNAPASTLRHGVTRVQDRSVSPGA